jgi:hypothetical protein
MKRDGEFDNAQARAQMPAGGGHCPSGTSCPDPR